MEGLFSRLNGSGGRWLLFGGPFDLDVFPDLEVIDFLAVDRDFALFFEDFDSDLPICSGQELHFSRDEPALHGHVAELFLELLADRGLHSGLEGVAIVEERVDFHDLAPMRRDGAFEFAALGEDCGGESEGE